VTGDDPGDHVKDERSYSARPFPSEFAVVLPLDELGARRRASYPWVNVIGAIETPPPISRPMQDSGDGEHAHGFPTSIAPASRFTGEPESLWPPGACVPTSEGPCLR
jgi:hypothetical protein